MKKFNFLLIHPLRNKGKTIILFFIIFLLTIIIFSSILFRESIVTTDDNLRRQLPAIATISQNIDAHVRAEQNLGFNIPLEPVRASMIREIGELPYVRMYDYSSWGFNFFSEKLIRTFNENIIENQVLVDNQSLRFHGIDFEQFILKGIRNPLVADLETGLIELIDGRVFTEDEISTGSHVVLVSESFAFSNNLQVGDKFILEYRIYHEEEGSRLIEEFFDKENLLGLKVFELEIIGLFEHTLYQSEFPTPLEIGQHISIINQIYVPNRLIESTLDLYYEVFIDTNPEILAEFLNAESLEDFIQREHMIFLLDDPIDLQSFRLKANDILPDFWEMRDLSNAYANITNAMNSLNELATNVLIATLITSILAVGLLTQINVKERIQEIGIYLALGRKKTSIIIQFLLEILIISIIASLLGLLVATLASHNLSTRMLKIDMANQANRINKEIGAWNSPESLGFRFEMTHEEMLEHHSINLNSTSIIQFILIIIVIFGISTSSAVFSIVRLEPKELLIQSKIQ